MTTVADVLRSVETLAPKYMKESWDNVGLNCGHMSREVHKILVALDPFCQICQEAKAIGADLLVTHHALLWNPGFVTDETAQGANALFLMENGIAHINAHTNLDLAPGGVNDVLAAKLGLQNVEVVNPVGADDQGRPYGLLHKGEIGEMPLSDFLAQVKAALGTSVLRYSDGGKPVRVVCVGGGSCAGELMEAVNAGCDTFVTADVKYNQFWDAQDAGLSLVDAGHFYTENPVVEVLADHLRSCFPEVEVAVSKTHRDCMEFF